MIDCASTLPVLVAFMLRGSKPFVRVKELKVIDRRPYLLQVSDAVGDDKVHRGLYDKSRFAILLWHFDH